MQIVTTHREIEEICRDKSRIIDKYVIMFLAFVPLEKDNFSELKNFYETLKEKSNTSQRGKNLVKIIVNQYNKDEYTRKKST